MNQLDIIIPVKNEELNILPLVKRLNQALKESKVSYTLIFVDDRSTDSTLEVLNGLKERYPLKVYSKVGSPGKAYSIIEGAKYATSEWLLMIDADLQYPPEVIPSMILKSEKYGVVVANRKKSYGSKVRRLFSRSFNGLFGKLLHGFDHDVQSGLKLFRKEIIDQIDLEKVTPWTLDLSLLSTAREMGFSIGKVDITFYKRVNGTSHVNLLKDSLEIGTGALKLKFNQKKLFQIKPTEEFSMLGGGVIYKRKRFITHTKLIPAKSAIQTFVTWQKLFIVLLLELLVIGGFLNLQLTAIVVVGFLSAIYFIDSIFNLFVILKSLHFPPEVYSSERELEAIDNRSLPIFSILCPLYKEANILPHFLDSMSKLDWPKNRLDVLLLLEADDKESIRTVKKLNVPGYVRVLIVPDSRPKTKPKACNYGLNFARGDYLVVYDAEDIPEPSQLKKAYLAFQKVSKKIICLQAKLNYHNPNQNLLTRFFTAEYSLWFDIVLTGLQSIGTVIPLGGTSNIFRTNILRKLHGWDPFNVTEDCDLGTRLFKEGYKTAIIDSITFEEANSNSKNWLRQRSRWIKGYMQTYLVHMRSPLGFVKKHKIHAFVFQLVIGARISFMIINPFLWVLTLSYFLLNRIVGPTIESLYPAPVFYMAVTSLVFGNFMYIYNYMIGCAKRGQWTLIKYIYLVPIYWLLASISAYIAFYQLLFKPHYWEKTRHGLHLKYQAAKEDLKKVIPEIILSEPVLESGLVYGLNLRFKNLLATKKLYFGVSLLVSATIINNFFNFLLNAYLGRELTLTAFGNLSLFTSLTFISAIPLSALSATVTQKIAYLFGKASKEYAKGYLEIFLNKSLFFGLAATLIWVLLIPLMMAFFKSDSPILFIAFTPLWLITIMSAFTGGYLKGILSFGSIALMVIVEAISKLAFSILLINLGLKELVYIAIPISATLSLIVGYIFANRGRIEELTELKDKAFNFSFYISSLLTGTSNIVFLGLDVILVKHFLTAPEVGQYALLSLPGKMIYFFGTLLSPLMLPVVARNEGASKKSEKVFLTLFGITLLFTIFSAVSLQLLGSFLLPVFFGPKIVAILPLLPIYIGAIALFTISSPIVAYFQAKENHSFVFVGFISALAQIILLTKFHGSLNQVVFIMLVVSSLNLSLMLVLYSVRNYFWLVERAVRDLSDLFLTPLRGPDRIFIGDGKKRILIFNWRDINHKWAGGAEVYIHELSKNWVKDKHQVTVFCGNDGQSLRYEEIDGISIVRRGGFYTVYFWAFLYYFFRFRNTFDIVIDSANGIPFFSPLYVRVPKFLLIHHIHQEVFRTHLPFPLSTFARFLESKLMPFVYNGQRVITVSQSSKAEILKLSTSRFKSIDIVNPGIIPSDFIKLTKTKYPSFLYLGRIQPYKNIDVIIKAFAKIIKSYPKAKLTIAGSGESVGFLKKLTKQLGLEEAVLFIGRVTHGEKIRLYASSWVLLQPSMMEGWGITVIEANASGTPVIASNVNGLKDSVIDGKTGLLVQAKNVDQFALVMLDVIKNKDFRTFLSYEAFQWSKNFSWDKSAKHFFKLIDEGSKDSNPKLLGKLVLAEGN